MAPREKVLCDCCGVKMSREREREHRRTANSKPYAPPTGIYESKQRRVYGPISGPSSGRGEEPNDNEAGPSGTYSSGSEPGPSASEHDDFDMDLDADPEAIQSDVDDDAASEDVGLLTDGLSGLVEPEFIMRERWKETGFTFGSNSEIGEEMDLDSEEETDDGDEVRDEDSDGENVDDDPDIFDWDRFEAPGLSAWTADVWCTWTAPMNGCFRSKFSW
ncbi:hypothetical protein B0H13DRAFT_2325724 [Mycena leptocephala]|nr:hypothetical protein B0H13DRAFT_2325724 [Mycena leptocephala]